MADVKYQVFVSSTYTDLVEERQALSRAVLDMGHIPAGMEMFPAADVEQLTYIKKVIDECDYYVLIVGARYGSLDPEGISFTEREYDYAVETGKTVLAFLHKNIDEIPLGKSDKDEVKFRKLADFKDKVGHGRLVKFWGDSADLASQAILALTKAFKMNPQVGWVRANTVPSQSTMSDVIKFRNEIDRLKEENKGLRAKATPRFDDAANLSERVTFTYTHGRPGYTKSEGKKEISFLQVLQLLAPTLHTATTILHAERALERGLRERHGAPDSLSLNRPEVQDALLHLVATGHVKMWAGTTKANNGVTAYQLTESGVKAWQEMSYVKKSSE